MPSFLRKDQNENCQLTHRHKDKTNCFLQCTDRNELPRSYADKTVLRHANIIMEEKAIDLCSTILPEEVWLWRCYMLIFVSDCVRQLWKRQKYNRT